MHDAIVLDTETTHIVDPEVIELAWRAYGLSGEHDAGGVYRFFPSVEISVGACATHHIIRDDLEGCFPSSRAPTYVPAAGFWIGHNVDFDWKALGQPPVRRICTLAMCRAIWPKCDSHSLTAMLYFLEGMTPKVREKVRSAHGAVADVAMCLDILNRIVEDEGFKTLEDLYAFSEDCRVPRIMGFGKYKGEPIANVDKGWANWYVRQADTDPYLITALKRARKL